MIRSYSLSEDDVDYLIRLPEVIHAKKKIDLLSNNGRVNFYIDIPTSLKRKIGNKIGINLTRMKSIPMRWIKGDTTPHKDACIKDFANTYLVYLTNSQGSLIIDGNVYAIVKGNAYVFSEGLRHETSGTGLEPRLLLGPMSEDGNFLGSYFDGFGCQLVRINTVENVPEYAGFPRSPPPPVREYDQILSGDVTISKVSVSTSGDYSHKITFSKKNISNVLMYQVWSDSSVELNNDRIVKEVKATTWVKRAFRKIEDDSGDSDARPDCICTKEFKPVICANGKKYSNNCVAGCAGQTNCVPFSDVPFTPTCVMELNNRHVFVINNAKVNQRGQVVFYVSSQNIVLPSSQNNPNNKELKLLKKIPTGSFRKARFDIDASKNNKFIDSDANVR